MFEEIRAVVRSLKDTHDLGQMAIVLMAGYSLPYSRAVELITLCAVYDAMEEKIVTK